MPLHSVIHRSLALAAAVFVLTALGAPGSSPSPLAAQSVDQQLRQLAEANADRYLEPLVGALGGALATPAFDNSTPLGRFGFDFGLRMGFTFFPEGSDSFTALVPGEEVLNGTTFPNPYQVRGGGSLTTPTVMGDGAPVVLEPTDDFAEAIRENGMDPDDWVIRFPEGIVDLSALPTGLAQVSMGLGFGSEITLRFLPSLTPVDEVGAIGSYGFGVRHAISYWFPSALDVSFLFGRQYVDVGEYLDGSASHFGLMVGRPFGPVTLFGSGLLRTIDLTVSYETVTPTGGFRSTTFPVSIDSSLTTSFGVRTLVGPANLTALYTRDDYSTLSLKVGVGVR